MYCDKSSVNILTSLMLRSGIRDVVVCPGARNGVLAHNFNELMTAGEDFRVYAVTDERSAAFVALGICLSRGGAPVAVCVTSGSAVLGTLPAVAEAFYRHLPLLVLSADRPERWQEQLDGQTLPQAGRLSPFAATFTLPEPHDAETERHCVNVVSHALAALTEDGGRPVHLNLPLSEPLFTFTTPALPTPRYVNVARLSHEYPIPEDVIERINAARMPVLLVGQMDFQNVSPFTRLFMSNTMLIVSEVVANLPFGHVAFSLEHHPELLAEFRPDLVVHVGGNLVNKAIKLHLRELEDCDVVRIESGRGMPNTFNNLTDIVYGNPVEAVLQLSESINEHPAVWEFWNRCVTQYKDLPSALSPQMELLTVLRPALERVGADALTLHLANSTVVRDVFCVFHSSDYRIHCNRGVNGIEGSMSTAVGAALAGTGIHLLLIGDLSFFYDVNALWNVALPARLRIILFNNGGGNIFNRLPGLENTPARDSYIAAHHNTSARGICEAFGLCHLEASSAEEAAACFPKLLKAETDRPILLEVKL